MINLSTSGDAVVFTFTDSDRYLYGTGTITVPLNSLLLVTDSSNMATFKKAASNDVFVSALYSELGMTKDELISWFEENAVGSTGGGGGGGITSGQVQTMINTSLEDYSTSSEVETEIDDAVSVKLDASAYTPTVVDSTFDSGSTNPLANSAITDHLNTVESVIATSLLDLDTRKLDASAYTPTDLSNYYTSAQTESAITAAVSGKQDTLVSGRGISIDTANTISCTLNLENGTNSQSGGLKQISNGAGNNVSGRDACAFGGGHKVGGMNAFVCGYYNSGNTNNAFISGYGNQTTNGTESLLGNCALSNGANNIFNGDSGATSFAVGNGTSNNRHNAFEIRQNGDLYVANTNDTSTSNYYEKPMVKLQDYIQYKIVKLSQADYDALVQAGTVDANTVYFITSSNS